MKYWTATGCAALLAVSACSPTPEADPVVVFASPAQEPGVEQLFAEFTDQTGIGVVVRYEDSAVITSDVIENAGAPPADVLMTDRIEDIWNAADRGALRPLGSPRLSQWPENLRDPDGYWVAVDFQKIVVLKSSVALADESPAAEPAGYADLADAAFAGQVCLSASGLPVNQTLVAMLIAELGIRPAELVVRGWIRNLAEPPFETEAELLAAVVSGRCDYGLALAPPSSSVDRIVPVAAYVVVDAIGVARHARQPESAQALIDWLLERQNVEPDTGINSRNVGLAAWHGADAVKLNERARYP